jgi:hypothetical protein
MKVKFNLLTLFILIFTSCSPYKIILSNSVLPSIYFEQKIKRLEKEQTSFQKNRDLIKTKIEYSYGVILEHNDRIIEDEYLSTIENNKKAYNIFKEVQQLCLINLNSSNLKFDDWMNSIKEISFKKDNIYELYYLAASLGGAIKTSQGDPKELINFPKIGELLKISINMDPKWNNGALQSAMMSYTASRMDISREVMKDTVNGYFKRARDYSDSLDASIFVSYAELIHKPDQNKTGFIKTLERGLSINTKKDSYFRLSNIIAQRRAQWLLLNLEDYFIE